MLDAWPFGVDRDSVIALLPGDLLAILVFVAAGEVRHNLPPWEFPIRYVRVALPFLVGWAVTSFALGAYGRRTRTSPRRGAGMALLAWVLAALVAMAIRDTAAFPGDAHPDFYLVAVAVGGALVICWRVFRVGVLPRVRHKL